MGIVKERAAVFQKLKQAIFKVSTILLDNFLSDDADNRMAENNLQEIRMTLRKAAQQKELVVLQIETDKSDRFETIAGWIVGKNIGKDQIVIKIQNDQQQIRIISLMAIKKISTLPQGKKEEQL